MPLDPITSHRSISSTPRLITICLAVSLCILFTLLLGDGNSHAGELRDTVKSGCETGYPPFCLVNAEGEADGFSVDLMRAALAAVGHDVTFRVGPWPVVKKALEDGEIQALPLVGRTPERELVFDFTPPYLTMHGAIVVRDDESRISTLADLRDKDVAVLKDDNAEEFLRREDIGVRIAPLDSFATALKELSAGKHDAVVVQRLLALRLMKEHRLSNLRFAGKPLQGFKQSFCFAVREGDKDLLAHLNEGLAIVIADGTYRTLYSKWFASLELASRKRLVVGGDFNYPPYEYLDADGRPSGFNVELTRALAKNLEIDVQIRLAPWDDIRQELSSGEIDLVGGMFYSSERDKRFDFSVAHNVIQHVAVTRKPSTPPTTIEALRGKKLVVMQGDIMHDFANQHHLPVTAVATQKEALEAVAAGDFEVALVARVPAMYWIQQMDLQTLRVGSHSFLSPRYCFAATNNNAELVQLFSEELTAYSHTPAYNELREKWLGVYEPDKMEFWDIAKYVGVFLLPVALLLGISLLWSRTLRVRVTDRTRDLTTAQEQLARNRDRLQSIINVLQHRDEPEQTFLDHALEEAIALSRSKIGYIYFYDEKKEEFILNSWSKNVMKECSVMNQQTCYELNKTGLWGEAVRQRKPIIVNNFDMPHPHRKGTPAGHAPLHKYMTIPIFDHDKIVAVLGLANKEEDYTNQDVEQQYMLMSTVFEISGRKHAESELLDFQRKAYRYLNIAGVMILALDRYGRVDYLNQYAADLLGYQATEIVGKDWFELAIPIEEREAMRPVFRQAMKGELGSFDRHENIILCKDGTEKLVAWSNSLLRDAEGDCIGVVSSGEDVTERRAMEHRLLQSEKMDAIGQLAGGIAHDFNNQLTGILGYSDMLHTALEDPKFSRYAKMIQLGARRATDLTAQLLAYARKGKFKQETINIHDMIHEVVGILERTIDRRIVIKQRLEASPATTCGDPTQIQNMLLNLAINARDAMPQGGELCFETGVIPREQVAGLAHDADTDASHFLHVKVSDTGVGMPDEVKEHIFEPFFTTKAEGKGTGMGLAAAYGTVKSHHGTIRVTSHVGKGTAFSISLPLSIDPQSLDYPEPDKKVFKGVGHILVIDDDELSRDLATDMLETCGYTVANCEDGQAGVAYITNPPQPVDLIVLDMIMPRLGGHDTFSKLHVEAAQVPILLVSGYSINQSVQRLIDMGAVGFIQKPFTQAQFSQKIAQTLADRR